MIIAILKDLFWKDQFITHVDNKKKSTDRDRFFLAQLVLYTIVVFSVYDAGILNTIEIYDKIPGYHVAQILFGGGVFQRINEIFNTNIMYGFWLLIPCLLIGKRFFGLWFMIPIGLINFLVLKIIEYISYIYIFNPIFEGPINYLDASLSILEPSSENSTIIQFIKVACWIFLISWLIINIFMLFKPSLKILQPNHPLLKMNSLCSGNKQLNSIQFMWRSVFLALISVGVAFLGAFLIIKNSNQNLFDSNIPKSFYVWIGFVFIVAIIIELIFVIMRWKNVGGKVWVLFGFGSIAVPLLQLLTFYLSENYFYENIFLFLGVFCIYPFMKLFLIIYQVSLLIIPSAEKG